MDSQLSTQTTKDHPFIEPRLDDENTTDAAGYWFTAAVVFAVLAAGIIVYRAAANYDIQTASIQVAAAPEAARASPIEYPPVYSHIEGIDP
jgi:hypothetical protein